MRRIGRWMLNALTALSLLLCAGTCVLWVATRRSAVGVGFRQEWHLPFAMSYGPSREFTISRPACFFLYFGAEPGTVEVHFYFTDDTLPEHEPRQPGPRVRFYHDQGDWTGHSWLGPPSWRAHGFKFWKPGSWSMQNGVAHYLSISPRGEIADWFLVLIFALLPAIRVGRRIFRRRVRSNECTSCGYNLTGNVSGVCPECGMKIAEAG